MAKDGQTELDTKVNTHSTAEALPEEYDKARAEPQRSQVKSEAAQACSNKHTAQAKHSQETARAQAEYHHTQHKQSRAEKAQQSSKGEASKPKAQSKQRPRPWPGKAEHSPTQENQ